MGVIIVCVISSVIVSALVVERYMSEFTKVTDKLDKEYVDRMVEETLKLIKESE